MKHRDVEFAGLFKASGGRSGNGQLGLAISTFTARRRQKLRQWLMSSALIDRALTPKKVQADPL